MGNFIRGSHAKRSFGRDPIYIVTLTSGVNKIIKGFKISLQILQFRKYFALTFHQENRYLWRHRSYFYNLLWCYICNQTNLLARGKLHLLTHRKSAVLFKNFESNHCLPSIPKRLVRINLNNSIVKLKTLRFNGWMACKLQGTYTVWSTVRLRTSLWLLNSKCITGQGINRPALWIGLIYIK